MRGKDLNHRNRDLCYERIYRDYDIVIEQLHSSSRVAVVVVAITNTPTLIAIVG